MAHPLLSGASIISLISLSAMEVVLGIDNIVFLSILSNKLPVARRPAARRIGLTLALVLRVALLSTITWIMQFTKPLFMLGSLEVTGRDLILFGGGLFLIVKSAQELWEKVRAAEDHDDDPVKEVSGGSYALVLLQIAFFDLVFSLDSIITAVGMTQQLPIMIGATLFAVLCMMLFADKVSKFIDAHPGVKILALAFLILVGVVLIAEAFHEHIHRTTVYTAMGFSFFVELMCMKYRSTKGIPDSQPEARATLRAALQKHGIQVPTSSVNLPELASEAEAAEVSSSPSK